MPHYGKSRFREFSGKIIEADNLTKRGKAADCGFQVADYKVALVSSDCQLGHQRMEFSEAVGPFELLVDLERLAQIGVRSIEVVAVRG